jgi:hypothetical protein
MKTHFSALVLRVFLEIILERRNNGQQQNKSARSVTLADIPQLVVTSFWLLPDYA